MKDICWIWICCLLENFKAKESLFHEVHLFIKYKRVDKKTKLKLDFVFISGITQ